METDEGLYHASPQTNGRVAHEAVVSKKYSNRKDCITALPIYSSKYGLTGRIDIYRADEKLLIERKIDQFAKDFSGADSVIIFDVSAVKLKKYGNAIHRDTDIVYF